MQIKVPTTEGVVERTVYTIDTFPYKKFLTTPRCYNRGKAYLNISSSFDIETTSMRHNRFSRPIGFMYIWGFCLYDSVIMGRTWEEYTEFIERLTEELQLSENTMLVTYSHNLGYEFQFMKNFITVKDMFAKAKRKPLKFRSHAIEYRCSYYLSNMSLDKFCENSELCKHRKLTAKAYEAMGLSDLELEKLQRDFPLFDYDVLRTPTTVLKNHEYAYLYNDCRGLCECIDTLLLEDTIVTIPMTSTGYVRRECRYAMKSNPANYKHFKKLKLLPHQYNLARLAFRGGNVHASMFMSGKILENVYSFDETSAYPAMMLYEYYPMGKFCDVTLDTQEKLDYYTSKYCVIMECTFYDIQLDTFKTPIPYIDIAHCNSMRNVKNDNGRVLSADCATMQLTELDLQIIRDTYKTNGGKIKFHVERAMYSKRGYLPFELLQTMLDYYEQKTSLSGSVEDFYLYCKSKNKLNAIFGMMVTDILHSMITYLNGEWDIEKPDISAALDHYYNSRNNFLHYPWGVYITAHARTAQQRMILKVGLDLVYTDTDCIKFVGAHHIAEFYEENKRIMNKAITILKERDLQGWAIRNNYAHVLGLWDFEGVYPEFKTIGAKKYAYIDDYGKLHTTISGMNKKLTPLEMGNLHNLKTGRVFHNVAHKTSWYNDMEPFSLEVDNTSFITASNIALLETPYELGITNEYWGLLSQFSPNFIGANQYSIRS